MKASRITGIGGLAVIAYVVIRTLSEGREVLAVAALASAMLVGLWIAVLIVSRMD